jgi:hypothetical protein
MKRNIDEVAKNEDVDGVALPKAKKQVKNKTSFEKPSCLFRALSLVNFMNGGKQMFCRVFSLKVKIFFSEKNGHKIKDVKKTLVKGDSFLDNYISWPFFPQNKLLGEQSSRVSAAAS